MEHNFGANVHIMNHPLLTHKISLLRDKHTGTNEFRQLVEEIAMLSDHVEVGCGSILNPGTVIGRNTNVYPLSSVRGCVDADSIYKSKGEVEIVAKH